MSLSKEFAEKAAQLNDSMMPKYYISGEPSVVLNALGAQRTQLWLEMYGTEAGVKELQENLNEATSSYGEWSSSYPVHAALLDAWSTELHNIHSDIERRKSKGVEARKRRRELNGELGLTDKHFKQPFINVAIDKESLVCQLKKTNTPYTDKTIESLLLLNQGQALQLTLESAQYDLRRASEKYMRSKE